MTSHLPQEALRLDKPRRLERHGAPRGAGIGPERALQISEATGTSLQVGLVVQGVHIARCTARRGRQSAADRVAPASCVGSGEKRRKLGIQDSEQALTAPQVPPVNQAGKHGGIVLGKLEALPDRPRRMIRRETKIPEAGNHGADARSCRRRDSFGAG